MLGIGNALGFLALPHVIRQASLHEENRPFLAEFNYQFANRFALGTVVVAIPTALLLQFGIAGVLTAVVAAAVILAMIASLLYNFSKAWWQALHRTYE